MFIKQILGNKIVTVTVEEKVELVDHEIEMILVNGYGLGNSEHDHGKYDEWDDHELEMILS